MFDTGNLTLISNFSSPNRTRKSGARFFSTTGMTYGDTAVLSALMRLAMTRSGRAKWWMLRGVTQQRTGCGIHSPRSLSRLGAPFAAAFFFIHVVFLFDCREGCVLRDTTQKTGNTIEGIDGTTR